MKRVLSISHPLFNKKNVHIPKESVQQSRNQRKQDEFLHKVHTLYDNMEINLSYNVNNTISPIPEHEMIQHNEYNINLIKPNIEEDIKTSQNVYYKQLRDSLLNEKHTVMDTPLNTIDNKEKTISNIETITQKNKSIENNHILDNSNDNIQNNRFSYIPHNNNNQVQLHSTLQTNKINKQSSIANDSLSSDILNESIMNQSIFTVNSTSERPIIEKSKQTISMNPSIRRVQKYYNRLIFSLSNDLLPKYNIVQVIDKGYEKEHWTSYRLKSEVLYFETLSYRYEITRLLETDQHYKQKMCYKFSRIKQKYNIISLDTTSLTIPLDDEYFDNIQYNLYWYDFQWTKSGVYINNKQYIIRTLYFIPRTYQLSTTHPTLSHLDEQQCLS